MALGALAVLAAALAVAGWLAHRLNAPPALGYLVVGIAASPHALGHGFVQEAVVEEVAHFGVLIILFFIGMELDLATLTRSIRRTAPTMPFDLLLPMGLVATVALIAGWAPVQAWTLGIACALSSTLFGERLCADASSSVRERVLGVLISQDVAAAGLLALVAGLAAGGSWTTPISTTLQLLIALVVLTALASLIVPRLLDDISRTHQHELLVMASLATMLGLAVASAWAGNAELGALVAGVVAAEAASRFVLRTALRSLRDLSLAVFFLSSGMAVDIGQLWGHAALALGVAAAFFFAKTIVHAPAAMAAGLTPTDALRTAISLGAMGEMSLVLASVAGPGDDLKTVLLGAIIILLVVTPIMTRATPHMAGAAQKVLGPTRPLIAWVVEGLRRSGGPKEGTKDATRRFITNVILVLAWMSLVLTSWTSLRGSIPLPPRIVTGLILGIGAAVGLPLLVAAMRAYRNLVWVLVGLREGERVGAGRVRAGLVHAAVTTTLVLLTLPILLATRQSWPLMAGIALLAIGVSAAAWRQLSRFHHNLEEAVGRVLGQEGRSPEALDRIIQRYPWGLRMVTVALPPDSPLKGKTLLESRISAVTGATVAVVQRNRQETVHPGPDFRLQGGDSLVLMGESHQLARAEALLVSHGDALVLRAQSREATIEEVRIEEGSAWASTTLADARVKETTGCLVVGVMAKDAEHPRPFDARQRLEPGDRVILLGSDLQLRRAREAAQAPPDEED